MKFLPHFVITMFSYFIFATTLYAAETSSFDIDGIKLGASFTKTKKLMNLSCEINHQSEGYLDFKCGNSSCDLWEYRIFVENKDQIVGIEKNTLYPTIQDLDKNFNKIKEELIKKYGSPNITGGQKGGYRNKHNIGYDKGMCWGDCEAYERVGKNDSQYWEGKIIRARPSQSGPALVAKYNSWETKDTKYHNCYYFSLIIEDREFASSIRSKYKKANPSVSNSTSNLATATNSSSKNSSSCSSQCKSLLSACEAQCAGLSDKSRDWLSTAPKIECLSLCSMAKKECDSGCR